MVNARVVNAGFVCHQCADFRQIQAVFRTSKAPLNIAADSGLTAPAAIATHIYAAISAPYLTHPH
jgi:hypothetical protein